MFRWLSGKTTTTSKENADDDHKNNNMTKNKQQQQDETPNNNNNDSETKQLVKEEKVEKEKEVVTNKPQETRPGYVSVKGCTALVTGSSGLCGARLVEMLLERGAAKVIAFDITEPDNVLRQRFDDIQTKTGGSIVICSGAAGDLTSDDAVDAAFSKHTNDNDNGSSSSIGLCFHVGALVGPFYDRSKYMDVNYHGTVRIINGCIKYNVPKLIYSSSPSTRFTGADVTGQREEELPMPDKWIVMYAEAKAYGEMAVSKANDPANNFYTVSVAPHQIYGPYDSLFLPSLLETAGNGRLRIFGPGRNRISVCYVDNYCHGLMCGADALYDGSPALSKFYIVTDGPPKRFWSMINQAVTAMGFVDLTAKFHLPVWLLYVAAYAANVIGWLMNRKLKLNPFNVKMLTIHRYFSIDNAKRDLKYEPVVPYETAWPYTIQWFKDHWLPGFSSSSSSSSKQQQQKQKQQGEKSKHD